MDFLAPKIAYASLDTFLVKASVHIINPAIKLLFALAIMLFLWGVAEYIFHPDDEEIRTSSRMHMLWGIFGLTIMMIVWPIMTFMINTMKVKGINVNDGNIKVDLPES